jgi:hypothetical protein
MPRIDLNVPFHEKDQAKALGARWDPGRKLWYVPNNVDSSPFNKWIPAAVSPNIRAASYFLAEAARNCWRCQARSRVFGICLLGYETLYVDDDPTNDCWEATDAPAILSYVTFLADPAPMRLKNLAPHYRSDFSQTTQSFYWMNHCDRCGAKLGDFETIEEYGAALNPVTPEDASMIQLHEIPDPLRLSCGGICYIEFFAHMQR